MRSFFYRRRLAVSLIVVISLFASTVLFRSIAGFSPQVLREMGFGVGEEGRSERSQRAETLRPRAGTRASARDSARASRQNPHASAACCDKAALLTDADMPAVARYVAAVWAGGSPDLESPPIRFGTPAQAVYVAVRGRGARLTEAWETRGTTAQALAGAIRQAKASLPPGKVAKADALEINLTHRYREYRLSDRRSERTLFSNIYRGIRGLEIQYNDTVERYAPTYIIATNRSNKRLVERFRRTYGIDQSAMQNQARFFMFDGEQLLIQLGAEPKGFLMQRGNRFVEPSDVTATSTRHLADLAAQWLQNNVHSDGRMTYKYWPSAKQEAQSNNMIRQWMATVALNKVAQKTGRVDDWRRVERNIDYNLAHFYHSEDGYGLIEWRNEVKLGALALAALAILEHPQRSRWAEQEQALQRTINALWHEDGSFTTFFKPKGERRNQNFYPGETLLYWAALYERERDPEVLRRFMKSFEYYRHWHLDSKNRNPAFIPWHTQAYFRMWKLTGNDALKAFIFTMNDWLLPVQQWPEKTPFPDTLGRFYDPKRPFGPPHASSTGVYLEGLIDAFVIARETGDAERLEKYRRAINRGLRSVMQLQFADEVDMYYVSPSMYKSVYGGIRTTVYDNVIRCDNVQHNLMAILKIIDAFAPGDYGHH